MRKPLIYIIILSLLVVGCAEERHTHNPQLIVLDSLQRVSPDSAFSMLDKLNTVFLPEDSVYNNLIYTETILNKTVSYASDSAINKIVDYYTVKQNNVLLGRAYLCRSINRYKNGRSSCAITDALMAEKLLPTDDKYYGCKVQLLLGLINLDAGCYRISLERLKLASRYADEFGKNPTLIAQSYNYMAEAYDRCGRRDSFMFCIRHIKPLLSKLDNYTKADINVNIGDMYMRAGKLNKALSYLSEGEIYDFSYKASYIMGKVYFMMGNSKKANAHWMDAANSGSLPIREESLASLIKLNPNKVELYQQFYSVYKEMPHVDSDELSAFQMRLAQQEMQHETYIRTITLLYIIIGILLLLILSYLYYHHKMKIVRRRLSDINARYLGYLEDYNNAKCNIEELKNKIVKYQEDKEAPENWSIENMLLNADVVISLHRIASRGQCANEVNWQQLTQLISERDKSMAILLSNNPELSDREQHVVMLIRLRFIPSEISVLMDISAQNVTNMRQRLMQKMFGENGGARDFDRRIHELQRPQF